MVMVKVKLAEFQKTLARQTHISRHQLTVCVVLSTGPTGQRPLKTVTEVLHNLAIASQTVGHRCLGYGQVLYTTMYSMAHVCILGNNDHDPRFDKQLQYCINPSYHTAEESVSFH